MRYSFFLGIVLCLVALGLALPSVFAETVQFDDTVSAELKTQVLSDFDSLKSFRGLTASPLHQEIFGSVDGDNYLQWFNARVYLFGVDACGGPGSVACQDDNYPNQIFVTDNYISNGYPQIARLMTVFHEARHTEVESGHWPHARCSNTFSETSIWTGLGLKGHYACDDSEYGSYASASVLLNNISKFCTTCSSKTKADAELYSKDQIKRVTESTARARMEADFLFSVQP